VALLAAVATLGLLASGCGGGSSTTSTTTTTAAAAATTTAAASTTTPPSAHPGGKAAYVAKMRAIGRHLGVALNDVESAQTSKQAAADFRKVQAQLRTAQKQLEAITPPAGIEKEHAALAKAVGEFADELGPIISKLEAGNINAAGGVSKLKGYLALRTAAAAIVAAGYKIGA
jgi:pyruvate/2-oxoglutarate dehydrogenase complex dihydrolipoamide acyltransferase (E2) component